MAMLVDADCCRSYLVLFFTIFWPGKSKNTVPTTEIGLFWYHHNTLGFSRPQLENLYLFRALIFKILLPQENFASGGLERDSGYDILQVIIFFADFLDL